MMSKDLLEDYLILLQNIFMTPTGRRFVTCPKRIKLPGFSMGQFCVFSLYGDKKEISRLRQDSPKICKTSFLFVSPN